MNHPIVSGIIQAIQERRPLQFPYQGHVRIVCPYMLGETTATKGLVLHAYQYAGEGSKGPIKSPEAGSWRFFYLSELESGIGILPPGTWYPPALQKAEDKPYKAPAFVTKILALVKL